jgi:RimJ/RimL family protein N-acetyltransferase
MSTRLKRWSDQDLPLLHAANMPRMTEHLGGPESDADVEKRRHKYLKLWDEAGARMFAIVDDNTAVGGIGWWTRTWRGREVYETGWFVVPNAQRRGVAREAVDLVVRHAAQYGTLDTLTAFPEVFNTASNALCRRTGFSLEGTSDVPFRGATLRVNAWSFDLRSIRTTGFVFSS